MPPKKRKYDEQYIEFGFTCINKNGEDAPQCVICYQVLSVHSMKPALLKRHLQGNHPELQSKDADFFRRKRDNLKQAKLDGSGGPLVNFTQQRQGALMASYKVALRIAQQKKPHTIAENLLLPSAKDMVECIIGTDAAKKLSQIPLSNNSVQRRILEMSADIEQQVVSEIKCAKLGVFSIQLDESTDVSDLSQLLVYVKYIHGDKFKEEFLFCKPLLATTKGIDVFRIVNEYFSEHRLTWKNVLGVCTDGAPSMIGCKSGFQALVKKENQNGVFLHCMLHRQALAVKTMPDGLLSVMTQVIKMINFVKNSALKSRLFSQLCEENQAQFSRLLYYSEVRWLTRGASLKRVYDLKDELAQFCEEHKHTTNVFEQNGCKLAYLVDIYDRMNRINLQLQGQQVILSDVVDKLNSTQKKLQLWKNKVKDGDCSMFETLKRNLNDRPLPDDLGEDICNHLDALHSQFQHYFPDLNIATANLARNPFRCNEEDIGSSDTDIQEEFIDLQNDSFAKDCFKKSELISFWCQIADRYKKVAKHAMTALLPFPTSYLCEAGFSSMTHLKTKFRNRLDLEPDMRCACSKTTPRIDELVKKHQAQVSH